MLLQLTASAYCDYLNQMSFLARDPIAYGLKLPRGDGHPVLLIPGFTAGDWTLGTMSRWLRRIGYRPYFSGIDLNVGCPRSKLELVQWRVEKIARDTGDRVTIIGHSLGGVLARAIALSNPAQVRRVVALGTPIRADKFGVHEKVRPTLEVIQSFWQTFMDAPENCGTAECPCGFADAISASPSRNTSFHSIFTRADEVVHWESCIDEAGTNLEVSGRHLSLIVNRDVYRLVSAILTDQEVESAALEPCFGARRDAPGSAKSFLRREPVREEAP